MKAAPFPTLPEIAAELDILASLREQGMTPERARKSAPAFVRLVARDENDHPVVMDTVTRIITSAFVDCKRAKTHLALVTPPGLGKSSLARWLFLREIGRNPRLRSVVISADSNDATNSVSLCRSILLSSAFKQVFPGVEPDYDRSMDGRGWRQREWFLRATGQRKDPTMGAKACIPKGESLRVDMLLADDVMTKRTSEEPFRTMLTDAFFKTWIEGRLSNGGWCLYLQNVWNEQDLAHRLRESASFCSVWLGMNDKLDGMFLKVWNPPPGMRLLKDPKRFGLKKESTQEAPPVPTACFSLAVPENRQALSPETMAKRDPSSVVSLFQLKAVKPGDLMYPSWGSRVVHPLTACELVDCGEDRRGLPVMDYTHRMKLQVAGGLDLSSRRRKGTALWLLARNAEGRILPLELHCGALTLSQMVVLFRDIEARGIFPSIIHVENNGVQDVISEALGSFGRSEGDQWALRIVDWTTGLNKKDVDVGLPAIETDLTQGVFQWPAKEQERETAHASEWKAFDRMMLGLPRLLTRGATPDTMMAFWMARRALDALGAPGKLLPPVSSKAGSRDKGLKNF